MKKDSHWHEEKEGSLLAPLEKWGRKLFAAIIALLLEREKVPCATLHLSSFKSILLIKEPYRMGDLFQITPALKALKIQFPQIKIGLVVQDRNGDVFKNNPHVDDLFLYKKREINWAPWKIFKFLSHIRSKKYEIAVTLETERTHLTNDLIALFSGVPFRVRYEGSCLGDSLSNAFYTVLVPFNSKEPHEVDKNSGVLKSLGLRFKDKNLEFICSPAEIERGKGVLKNLYGNEGIPSKIVLIHPGSYKIENRWSLKNYMEVAHALTKNGVNVLFALGPSELEWRNQITSQNFPVIVGESLGVMGAIMQSSRLVFCNDTGILHLASACDVPTVALFGKTDLKRWKPPQKTTRAIQTKDKEISSISADHALREISQIDLFHLR